MFLSIQNHADMRSHRTAGHDGDAWLGSVGLFATHLLSLLNPPPCPPALQDFSVPLPVVSATGHGWHRMAAEQYMHCINTSAVTSTLTILFTCHFLPNKTDIRLRSQHWHHHCTTLVTISTSMLGTRTRWSWHVSRCLHCSYSSGSGEGKQEGQYLSYMTEQWE